MASQQSDMAALAASVNWKRMEVRGSIARRLFWAAIEYLDGDNRQLIQLIARFQFAVPVSGGDGFYGVQQSLIQVGTEVRRLQGSLSLAKVEGPCPEAFPYGLHLFLYHFNGDGHLRQGESSPPLGVLVSGGSGVKNQGSLKCRFEQCRGS